MELRDWVLLLTALVQLSTAIILNLNSRQEKKKKGTKRRIARKR
ncbi:hypothetical protein KMC72_gp32 [Paenibacillus phage Dragolir]|uniref:Holin n=1 Tax=Paenibacillus phage Dragolir TaxID=2070190 RepID=A0A2I7SC57_9CAUD|nr:hypothetical protein KMC72_gp32 [Paenibacillus phage Dragolir]AUS03472.1 hypothetical protein DRAGOLIR_32 [Paenibacillus phage Dragolir]